MSFHSLLYYIQINQLIYFLMLLFCIESILGTFSFDTLWFCFFLLPKSSYNDFLLFLLWLLYFVNNIQQLFLLNIFSLLFLDFLSVKQVITHFYILFKKIFFCLFSLSLSLSLSFSLSMSLSFLIIIFLIITINISHFTN